MKALKSVSLIRAIAQKTVYKSDLSGLLDLGPIGYGHRLARHVDLTTWGIIRPDQTVIFWDDNGKAFETDNQAQDYAWQLAGHPVRAALPEGIEPSPAARRRAFDRAFLDGAK